MNPTKNNDWIKQYCQKQTELSEIIFEELSEALVESVKKQAETTEKQDHETE